MWRTVDAPLTRPSATPMQTLTGVIQVRSDGVSLGYVAPDPNYWTPLLTPDINSALKISFQMAVGATSANALNFQQLNVRPLQSICPIHPSLMYSN